MMPPTSGISRDIVSQNDKDGDSSLSIDELGIDEEQFSALDSNSDSLVTQDEIASAIDNKLSSFDGSMPSKDEFASLLSDLGLQMPEPPQKQASKESEDFASMIMSNYDSNSDSSLSSDELSLLDSNEFSALDSNGDGSISADELSSAVEQVATSQSGTAPTPPPGGKGGGQMASISSEEEYDELDTNKDGIVSQEEKNAALGISSTQSTTSNEDMKDTLKLLLDTIKLNAQNGSENTDLSSFKNIMKMMNNQNNSSDLNTYVSNLSTSNSSSKFSYA
jgi:hypothetical protein